MKTLSFYIKTLVWAILLAVCLPANAQNLVITPDDKEFKPVTFENKWHVINTKNTTYTVTPTAPKDAEFKTYRIGTVDYSEEGLKETLKQKSKSEEVSVIAVWTSTKDSTEVTSTPVNLKFYDKPELTPIKIPEDVTQEMIDENETKEYSFKVSGGANWSSDFYYQKDGGEKTNYTKSNEGTYTLSVPLHCDQGKSKTTITVVLKNIKCSAPDNQADWTPADARNIDRNSSFTVYPKANISITHITSPETTKEATINRYTTDSITPIMVNATGGNPEGWSYEWTGGTNTTNSFTPNIPPLHDQNKSEKRTDDFSVRVRNRIDGKNIYDETFTFHYITWSLGSISNLKDYNLHGGLENNEKTIEVSTFGGYDQGWSFDWKLTEGDSYASISPQDNGKKILVKASRTDDKRTVKLRLTATNRLDHKKGFDGETTSTITIYPEASSSSSFHDMGTENLYVGEASQELIITSSGGHKDGWSCVWNVNGTNKITGLKYSSQTKEVKAKQEIKATLTNKNPDGNDTWYKKEYSYNIYWWDKGSISASKKKMDLYGGERNSSGELSVIVNGGYPQGNTYKWEIIEGEDNIILTPNDSICEVKANRITDGIGRDATIRLSWENRIGNKLGSSDYIDYSIHIAPGAERIPSDDISGWADQKLNSETNPVHVRSIDDMVLSVCEGKGEVGNIWEYNWYVDGELTYGDDCQRTFDMQDWFQSEDTKVSIPMKIVFDWKYISKNGTLLDEGTLTQWTKFYNTPKTPAKLTQKGNGSSNIYIASMDGVYMRDNYTLQFGDNNELSGEEDSQLWHQYTSKPSSPWVRSCWRYDDGFACVSDQIDIYGKVRKPSVTNTTRGETSAISNVEENVMNTWLILTINGHVVMHSETSDPAELDLSPGIYLLKNQQSGNIHRIMIK